MFYIAAATIALAWIPGVLPEPLSAASPSILSAPFLVILLIFKVRLNLVAYDSRQTLVATLWTLVVVLTVFGFSSLGWAEDKFRAFRGPTGYLVVAVNILVLLSAAHNERLAKKLIMFTIWCVVLTAVLVIAGFFVDALKNILFSGGRRAYAGFKHANQLGIALSCIGAIPVAFLALSRRRVWPMVASFSVAGALMLSGSKANTLVLIVVACIVLSIPRSPRRVSTGFGLSEFIRIGRNWAIVIFGVIAAVSFLRVHNPEMISVIYAFAIEGNTDTRTMVVRKVIWAEAYREFLSSPWIGVGAGQPILGWTHAHNAALEYLRTLGIIGFVLWSMMCLVCIVLSFETILRLRRRLAERHFFATAGIGAAVGVIAYIVANQSSDSFGPSTLPIFGQALGIMLLCRRFCLMSPLARGPHLQAPIISRHFSLASASQIKTVERSKFRTEIK